ncbi:hypothetical protein ACH5RR_038230 [Cinchona calisaya]|uniref:RING-type domain-containing protein n=1 Tax=Cinchona calisaya TaxID=153742 RepID=A0ABD2XUQ2_9GENT
MGFLFHVIRLPTAITGAFILNLWSHLKFLAIGALTHLGIYKPPPDEQHESRGDNSNNYIFIFEGTCPSLVPIPIHVVTAAIKSKVPVVRFQDSLQTEASNLCTICLEGIDLKHEVRQLCRCSHVFHRDCLDTWVDSGQVTCPLCRSMLLPPKTNLTRCLAGGGDSTPPQEEEEVDSAPPPLITS